MVIAFGLFFPKVVFMARLEAALVQSSCKRIEKKQSMENAASGFGSDFNLEVFLLEKGRHRPLSYQSVDKL